MFADSPDAVDRAAVDPEQLAGWIAGSPVGLAVVDARHRVVLANDALARIAGMDAEHLVHAPALATGLARALGGELPPRAQFDAPGEPGRRVVVGFVPLGGVAGLVVAPATDPEVGEEALQLALEGTETGTWMWDVEGDRVQWSPNLGPLHGRDRGDAPRTFAEWLEGVHPEDRAAVGADIEAVFEGAPGYEREFRAWSPEREERWLHTRAHALRDERGRPQAIVGLTTDISARKRREAAAELLAHAGLVLARSLDAETTLQQIAELAVPRLADWCTAHLAREDGRIVRAAVAHADPQRVDWARRLEERYPPDEAGSGAAEVIRTGRSQLYPAIDEALLRRSARDEDQLTLMRALRMRSALVVPLMAGNRTLGAITLIYAESGRQYGPPDLALAEELGRRAGLAIDNARLHRAQQEANRRLRDLQAVTDVALTHLDLGALLHELLTRLNQLLEGDLTKVLLYDEDRSCLRVRASVGMSERLAQELRVPVGTGIAGRIAVTGRPLVLEDTAGVDAVLADLSEAGRSLAAVPLRLEGETLGVLVVSSRERRYREADLQLLELVADRSARAIRQAELYEQARDAALSLQRSLLPEALPSVRGMDVAARYLAGQDGTEVGGDWYDLFALPDGRMALVVGDVVGRGLRAAARMGRVRTALRAYAFEASSPTDALRRLDRLVSAEGQVEFTTLLVAFIDPATGEVRACCAGHLPPIVVGAEGARIVPVAGGPPLGVADEPRPETGLHLETGETMIAYTDGLVEDRATGLAVGIEDLRAAAEQERSVAPQDLVDRVVRRLLGARGSRDDVAIVAVTRVGDDLMCTYPAEPAAVATARHAVTSFAAAHGADERLLQDVALAVSEACTNVVVHAYRGGEAGPMHVHARREEDALEVVVTDEGGGVRPRGDSPGVGLGLQIITRTTERFDVRDRPDGGAELVLRFPLCA